MGSLDNVVRFESDAVRLSVACPRFMPCLPYRTCGSNIVDGVDLPVTREGREGCWHYSTTLNELRFQPHPVALDVL